ncbi:type II secretion system F family protein [Pseudothauera rhizosphaerae]|uniref:General secretion pathway protein F n=1 Tax=Pseudothauera rhizosphaerae TaxID=2565932 RepID=A0A4S4A7N4_9RHOO|nr:type II secretion system F family protein [Pseudothauera rhizosphaerae]THF54778.1 type II secretion system F family protein [Pseudothauera rhizosphaerae]
MASYRAKVFSEETGLVRRQVDATSRSEAQASLQRAGFRVVSIAESDRWRVSGALFAKRLDHTRFAQEVYTLLDAGLSLTEALQALRRYDVGDEAEAIQRVLSALRSGKRFSCAIEEARPSVPPLLVGLVSASEQTGNLSEALGRYVAYREKVDGVRKRLFTALIYPALLMSVGVLVVIFLLGFVVPRFASAYEGVVQNVPLVSRLMIEWAAMVRENGNWLLAGTFVGVFVMVSRARRALARRGLAGVVAWQPTLRARTRDYDLSRFYRTVGLQMLGGIPVVRALEMAADLLHGADRDAVEMSVADLRGGLSITDALTKRGLAPPVVSDLLRVGEQSGQLGPRMLRIADFLDESVSRWMEAFTRLFEPLVMLGLGIFVAGIVVLLYLPLFELAENIR